MFIRIASDLHLEGFQTANTEQLVSRFIPPVETDAESVLVLAGDISSFPSQLFEFLSCLEKKFLKVVYIPGNHEYYKYEYLDVNKRVDEYFAANLKNTLFAFGTVKVEVVNGVRFIFGTLWADGGYTTQDKLQVFYYLNDFRLIQYGDQMFSVEHMIEIHMKQKEAIRGALETPFDGTTVVVTHHLPSRRLISPRYVQTDGSDGANGGFASDCDNMIVNFEPDVWIFGHTHDTFDTTLFKTRMICNPAGYRGEWANPRYNTFMSQIPHPDPNAKKPNLIVNPKVIEV